MARSTPHRRLYCSICKAKDLQKVLLRQARTGYYDPTWFGVEVVGEVSPGKAQCKCLNCCHEWVSGSMAAKRELSAIAHQQERLRMFLVTLLETEIPSRSQGLVLMTHLVTFGKDDSLAIPFG